MAAELLPPRGGRRLKRRVDCLRQSRRRAAISDVGGGHSCRIPCMRRRGPPTGAGQAGGLVIGKPANRGNGLTKLQVGRAAYRV